MLSRGEVFVDVVLATRSTQLASTTTAHSDHRIYRNDTLSMITNAYLFYMTYMTYNKRVCST